MFLDQYKVIIGLSALLGASCGPESEADPVDETDPDDEADPDDETDPKRPELEAEVEGFEPVLLDTLAVAASDAALPGDIINEFLPSGARHGVQAYEVPSMPCVREYGPAAVDLPEAATFPGRPGVFYIAAPAPEVAQQGALVYTPHGNGLEWAESLVIYGAKHYPNALAQINLDPDSVSGYGNQTTREYAEWAVRFELGTERIAGFLERGWTVVAPGNCWGDLGTGSGEVARTEYEAPRYTRVLDTKSFAWARLNQPHRFDKVFADGCSGGGSRIGQQLQYDSAAFAAAVIDSPADEISGFRVAPYGDLVGFAYAVEAEVTEQILTRYLEGLFGSIEAGSQRSLGARLGRDVFVDAPILFAYSEADPLTPLPLTGGLLAALSDASRYHHPNAEIVANTEAKHCQFWRSAELHPVRMQWLDDRFAE